MATTTTKSRSHEGKRGKVYIVQSEANVTKCAAADVPGRSCTHSQAMISCQRTGISHVNSLIYVAAASPSALQLSWQEERAARLALTDIYRDTKMRSCTARSQELSQNCRRNIWRRRFSLSRLCVAIRMHATRSCNCIAFLVCSLT